MWPYCDSFNQCARRLPDLVQLSLGLAFIAALTVFKLTLGSGFMMIDFFILPVVGVGWFARSARYGYILAATAAVDSAVLAMHAETQSSWQAASLAGVARFALYFIILGLLGMMRRERASHQYAATTDRKTGAMSAHAFNERAQAEVEHAQRHGSELSLAYIDVDGFKEINDLLGHREGDRLLLEISHVMRSAVRASDTVGRVGGDEFAVLMPETNAGAARVVTERLRGELARVRTRQGMPAPCSIGLVTFDRPPASLGTLMDAGDELMYRAKRAGKDRIEQAERSGVAVLS